MTTPEFCDLIAGIDLQYLADYLHISPKTLKRYKTGATVPHAVVIAVRLKLSGDLAALGGNQWQGFTICKDGLMYLPGWRGGFEPHQIRAMFFQVQQVRSLEAQIRAIQRREAALEADIADALRQAAHYRRLTRLEANMGMMLERITTC